MITIPLAPYPAPRPRFSKYGTYNTKKYTEYKKNVLAFTQTQCKTYFEGALRLEINFYMPIPASTSKKKRSELFYHTKKPDLDNLVKSIMDSLEGAYFKNDSQFSQIQAQKIYSDRPRTEFKITKIF